MNNYETKMIEVLDLLKKSLERINDKLDEGWEPARTSDEIDLREIVN